MNFNKKYTNRFLFYPDETGKRQSEGGRRILRLDPKNCHERARVSIITVCFNSAKKIEKAMLSVFAQEYSNIEYIIIDGGSTDNTLELLHKYQNQIDYFISEPDNGIYDAMNKGIELASGEYILMLNSDDWYEPETVRKLVAAKKYSGCDFSGALARYVNENGTSHVLRSMPFDYSILLRMPLRHETMLVPASLYERVGIYDTNFPIIADYEFTVRLFLAGFTYYEVREPLLNFSTAGVSNTARAKVDQESRMLLARLFPFLSTNDLKALTDHTNVAPDTFIEIANANLDKPDFMRACRALLKDRKLYSGKRWQEAKLEKLATVAPLEYPKISVIIPFHNASNSLALAIGSALSQSLHEIEVICIDDASDDNSQLIVETFCASEKRVKLIRNSKNLGPGGSRNVGIRAARGQYVFFLDADDSIAEGALEKLYKAALTHGTVIVRGGFRAGQMVHGQKSNNSIKFPCNITNKTIDRTTLSDTPQLLTSTEGHWAGLYDTDFIQTILYPEDIRVGEDSLFFVKAHALAPGITVLPEVVYNYQANSNSTMNNMTSSKYFDGLVWRKRAWNILHDAGASHIGDHLLFNFWSIQYFNCLETTLTATEKIEYFKRLFETFAMTGHQGLIAIRNKDLRQHIELLFSKYVYNPKVQKKNNLGLTIATLTTQDHGGAGVGTQRRVEALRNDGVNAHIYCAFKKTNHTYVHKVPLASPLPPDTSHDKAWEAWTEQSVLRRIEFPNLKARELFSKTGTIVDFRDLKSVFNTADIVHLHWVSGLIDYAHLGETLKDKPVAWTLADMNAFTGGCHYSEGCKEYRNECCNCPLLGGASNLAHLAWKTKRQAYAELKHLYIICPSQWLANCAEESSLLRDRPIHVIPNAIPVDRFTPTNRIVARLRLGLPIDRKLILFGADSLGNKRKGGDILVESIQYLRSKGQVNNFEGLFFGANKLDLGLKTHHMGHVSDEKKMSLIYSAADVFAFPSREDNAPLTVVESMLSGTPVVGFPVGNVPVLIDHKINGYIAQYADSTDFAKGLAWALRDTPPLESLRQGLRACCKARTHNDPDIAVARHMDLYRRMLQ